MSAITRTNEVRGFEKTLAALKNSQLPIPAELRLELFKTILKSHPEEPEKVKSRIVRLMYDHDAAFITASIKKWEHKKEEAKIALKSIKEFSITHRPSKEMSLREHAHYCFCLSAILSGVAVRDLEKAYDKQLKTMVKGVVHPLGKWSIKTELENQNYAKYLFHVSPDGLASVELLNYMTSFRLDANSPFGGVRIVAVATGERVGFDGIEDCGSLNVLRHDFIHSGFLKFALQTDPKRYWELLEKIGTIYEEIQKDPDLQNDSMKKAKVEAAFFMWTHELTTSLFVDGWPRALPKKHWYLGGKFASRPQILLLLAAKFGLVPPIFSKEITTESGMMASLGLEMKGLNATKMSEKEKVKEIIAQLDEGYRYLSEKYDSYYGRRNAISVLVTRLLAPIKNFFHC